jgi:hypothetical protein
MPLEWLNHHIADGGVWQSGQFPPQPSYYQTFSQVTFPDANGRNLRIHETARSGSVLLTPVGGTLASYGDAEVYLNIIFANGATGYRSAPITRPIEESNVRTLQLFLLITIGNEPPGAASPLASITWRAYVNAHCIFERL